MRASLPSVPHHPTLRAKDCFLNGACEIVSGVGAGQRPKQAHTALYLRTCMRACDACHARERNHRYIVAEFENLPTGKVFACK